MPRRARLRVLHIRRGAMLRYARDYVMRARQRYAPRLRIMLMSVKICRCYYMTRTQQAANRTITMVNTCLRCHAISPRYFDSRHAITLLRHTLAV